MNGGQAYAPTDEKKVAGETNESTKLIQSSPTTYTPMEEKPLTNTNTESSTDITTNGTNPSTTNDIDTQPPPPAYNAVCNETQESTS